MLIEASPFKLWVLIRIRSIGSPPSIRPIGQVSGLSPQALQIFILVKCIVLQVVLLGTETLTHWFLVPKVARLTHVLMPSFPSPVILSRPVGSNRALLLPFIHMSMSREWVPPFLSVMEEITMLAKPIPFSTLYIRSPPPLVGPEHTIPPVLVLPVGVLALAF